MSERPNVILRAFEAADAPALAEIHRRAVEAVPDELISPAQRASWAAGIAADLYRQAAAEGEHVLVADVAGRPAAFCSFRAAPPEGEIRGLYTDPECQRQGLGRALVEAAEGRIFDTGAVRIRVQAGAAAEAQWRALGYRETGRGTYVTRGGLSLPVIHFTKAMTAARRRPARNFYGRRRGKHLRDSQEAYLEEDLARLSPGPVDWDENPERTPLDLDALFGGREVWLEIGFGGGEHMIHQAGLHPEVGLIGCEPYINGVAMLLGKIRASGVQNLRVHPGDVRDLFDVLPDASIAKAFLLYPDPWPKKKHHRRRFVTPEHLEPLARVMRPGAEFRVATDIPDYVRQTLQQVPRHGFEWLAERAADWRGPWDDWISTRYEQKALREGRVPHYLTFRKG